jgi:ribose/xylose/arabinose/galactoside ABC-type transport system permease subunit
VKLSPGRRALLYAVVGALVSAYVLLAFRQGKPLGGTDFDQIWYASRALLEGQEPYASVTSRPDAFEFPLYYPLTAPLLTLGLGALDFRDARLVFALLSGAVFGYAIGRYRPYLWPTFASLPFILVGQNGQWGGLLAAGLVLPWLAPLAAAKPNLGLVVLAGTSSMRAARILVLGGLALVAVSLVVAPSWPFRWLEAIEQSTHFRPLILRPGGFLMLLALLRWYDADARLLLALAAVPTTGLFYDVLPAALVARSRFQSAIITLSTQVVWLGGIQVIPPTTFAEWSWLSGIPTLWGGLIPPLAIVLARSIAGAGSRRAAPWVSERQPGAG